MEDGTPTRVGAHDSKKRRGSHSASPSPHAASPNGARAKRRRHDATEDNTTSVQLSHVAAAAAAQIAATSTAAAASLSSPARRPLDAAAPSPIGAPSPASSTASVHSVTMSRTHRRPKSRQLFGDAAWVEAAAADQGGRPPNADDRQQSTHARPASTASDIVVGRKKRSLKDAHAVTALVQPVASEAGPPSADALLFSSATYTSRDPLAQQAALVANTTLRPNTASSVQLSPTSHPAQSRSDAAGGDETEDDDLTAEDGEDDPDEYTMGDDDDDSTDGGESIDMKDGVSVAESKRSTGIHVNMTQPPFTFDPLNHRPWIAAFMDRHTLPLGTGTNSHTSATHAPSTLAHALRSHAFRVACQAHYAYTPLESWFFRGFDGSSSDASLVGMRFGTPDGFHRLLAERIGVAPEELPERMTRREWNVARRLIGCPRRISSAFLREERTRLHQAQQAAHQRQLSQLATGDATTSTNRHQTAPGSITDESSCPSFLAPGTRVFAPHPRGQLAPAVVLETRTNASADSVAYLVRFHDQARGATSVVPDNAIVLSSATVPTRAAQTAAQLLQLELLRASATAPGSGSGSSSARAHAPPFLHAESDRVLLARLLQLVDRKQVLLAELRRQNDTMATMRAQPANATTASNSTLYNTDTSSCVSVASVGEETAMEVDSAIASHPTHIGTDAGAHSITSASSPPLAPAASPAIALTPAQFATAYQLFQRQYAWVVLQLEATSQNLEATLTQLRLRRSSARRSTAALLDSSSSLSDPTMRALLRSHQRETDGPESLSRLHEEAHGVVKAAIKEMTALRILNKSSLFADPAGSAIQSLITNCITLVTLIQRCADEGRLSSSSHLSSVVSSLRPRHAAHMPAFEAICRSVDDIHRALAR